jgi:hypothetical protein
MQELVLKLPVSQTIRAQAQQFAAEQPTREKAEQVRLNTIAVGVVNNYLQMLDVRTNLANSDSWNPVLRLCADVADLEITGIGRLECRPIKTSQPACPIPPEVWESRIGYVVVQIDEQLREAQLLGFSPTAEREALPLKDLQPIEAMIDHLHQLKNPSIGSINLTQWFNQIFQTGWESFDSLFNSCNLTPAFNFRGAALAEPIEANEWQSTLEIRRGKFIDFGIHTLMLVINLKAIAGERVEVRLQIYPTETEMYLPSGLQLTIVDETDRVFMEAQARRADNAISIVFTGEIHERFTVQVKLSTSTFSEHFVI